MGFQIWLGPALALWFAGRHNEQIRRSREDHPLQASAVAAARRAHLTSLPKGARALVKLDEAEREVRTLTSLHEASEAARRAIAAQPGPTVLVGHSFSGMIVTDVGVDAPRPPGQIDARSAQRARRDRQARRGLPFAQGHLGRHYDPHGRLMLTVLGGLAEFERELIRWPPLFSGSPDYATIPLTTMAKSGPFTTER